MTKRAVSVATERTALRIVADALPRIEDKMDDVRDELVKLNGTVALHGERLARLPCERRGDQIDAHDRRLIVVEERVGVHRVAWTKVLGVCLGVLQTAVGAVIVWALLNGA